MNKTDLIRVFADKASLQKKQAAQLVDALMDVIMKTLIAHEEIKIIGFGTFKLTKVKAKTIINPQNKQQISIKEYTRIRFVPGKTFKDKINHID